MLDKGSGALVVMSSKEGGGLGLGEPHKNKLARPSSERALSPQEMFDNLNVILLHLSALLHIMGILIFNSINIFKAMQKKLVAPYQL